MGIGITASKVTQYEYKCKFCGKNVILDKKLSKGRGTEEFDGHKRYYRSIDYTKELAEDEVKNEILEFEKKYKSGNYSKFDSKCFYCGEKQPWGHDTINKVLIASFISFISGLILMIIINAFGLYVYVQSSLNGLISGLLAVTLGSAIITFILAFIGEYINDEKRTEEFNRPKIVNIGPTMFEY